MRELTLVNGRIVVRLKKIESKLIVLPDNNAMSVERAEGYITHKSEDGTTPFEVGDLVAYGQYAAKPILEPGEKDLYLIDEDSILYGIDIIDKESK